jgi:hypothetical protein
MTLLTRIKWIVVAVAIVTVAMVAWLALSPIQAPPGGHDHDPGIIQQFNSLELASLDAGPSCTHSSSTHYHDGGRTKHVTIFQSSHKHGTEHHHHGELRVTKSGALFSKLFDRQCPRH